MTFFEAYQEMKKGKIVKLYEDKKLNLYSLLRINNRDLCPVVQMGCHGWKGLSWTDCTMYLDYLDATDWEVVDD